eukprot:365703-Chlamydomonas_euryale.AAC.2
MPGWWQVARLRMSGVATARIQCRDSELLSTSAVRWTNRKVRRLPPKSKCIRQQQQQPATAAAKWPICRSTEQQSSLGAHEWINPAEPRTCAFKDFSWP